MITQNTLRLWGSVMDGSSISPERAERLTKRGPWVGGFLLLSGCLSLLSLVALVRSLKISEPDKQKILGGAAEALLGA